MSCLSKASTYLCTMAILSLGSNALSSLSVATQGGVAVFVKTRIPEYLHGYPGAFQEESNFQFVGHPDAAVHLHGLVGYQFHQFVQFGLGQAGQQWQLLRRLIHRRQGL